MSLRAVLGSGLAALLLATGPARAEEPPLPTSISDESGVTPMTLRELLSVARKHGPAFEVMRSPIDVAAAETVAANAYPNPNLSYEGLIGIKAPSYVNGTQHQLMLEQPILIGGQRDARQTAAGRGVSAARAVARADEAALIREIWTEFIDLLVEQSRLGVLRDGRADLARAESVVEGRAQGGVMSQYDLAKIRLEARGLQAELDVVEANVNDASARLATLAGIPGKRLRAVGSLDPSLAIPSVSLERIPNVVAARAVEAASVSRVTLADRERWPTPVVGLGGLFTTNDVAVAGALSLSCDLPLFDQGQGALARARAEQSAASRARALAVAQAEGELARAKATLSARRRALETFLHDSVSSLPEIRQMSEDAYKNTRGTILDLLDALRTINQVRLTEIDYRKAAMLAEVDALAAAGLVQRAVD